MCNIPLPEISQQIIENHKNHPICAITDRVLLLAYLKEIITLCGINKNVSTHITRHTFETYMLSKKVYIENIAKMLGHTNAKITHHYARVLDESIMRDILNVSEKINFGKAFK